jgi:hypothetical protein
MKPGSLACSPDREISKSKRLSETRVQSEKAETRNSIGKSNSESRVQFEKRELENNGQTAHSSEKVASDG